MIYTIDKIKAILAQDDTTAAAELADCFVWVDYHLKLRIAVEGNRNITANTDGDRSAPGVEARMTRLLLASAREQLADMISNSWQSLGFFDAELGYRCGAGYNPYTHSLSINGTPIPGVYDTLTDASAAMRNIAAEEGGQYVDYEELKSAYCAKHNIDPKRVVISHMEGESADSETDEVRLYYDNRSYDILWAM